MYIADPDIHEEGTMIKPSAIGQDGVARYYNEGIDLDEDGNIVGIF